MTKADRLGLWLLSQEATGLLGRVRHLKPFSLSQPMVAAANVSPRAMAAMEDVLESRRKEIRLGTVTYLRWLQSDEGRRASAEEAQRRYTFLRLRFNTITSQFDIFADVLSQRGEHETGIWVAGLDDVAADALEIPGKYFDAPPIVCYLDRGHGAAIRRARTRLPGGDENPVAVIRVPRERMVGSGVAASLVHEVGHQGAALLDLVPTLRDAIAPLAQPANAGFNHWRFWQRWISEIVADLWSVARLGIGSTMGLMAVVSLPRAFVFRLDLEDPHPMPWLRVKLSCAMGDALYPHLQWRHLAESWERLYPTQSLAPPVRTTLRQLDAAIPEFVRFLVAHRPPKLRGSSLSKALASSERRPEMLRHAFQLWQRNPEVVARLRPSLVFAAVGQAKANGLITPAQEDALLTRLLTFWAHRSSIQHATCVPPVAIAATTKAPLLPRNTHAIVQARPL